MAAILLASGHSALGATPSLALVEGSQVRLDGDSTLHKYHAVASKLAASFVLDGPAEEDLASLIRRDGVKSGEISFAATGLSSSEKRLDKNMWKALRAERYPNIRFQMSSYQAFPSTKGAAFAVKIRGRLEVGGVEQPIEVTAEAFVGSGQVRLIGSQQLRMSDFKVQAPVLMGGLMRTKNEVTITFDLRIRRTP